MELELKYLSNATTKQLQAFDACCSFETSSFRDEALCNMYAYVYFTMNIVYCLQNMLIRNVLAWQRGNTEINSILLIVSPCRDTF